jgi:multiple sugar transport system substrate-binding protein
MDVAIHFMEWWYLKDTQLEFARRGGNPVTAAAVNSPGFEEIQPWHRVYKYMLTESHANDFWHEPTYAEMLAYQQEKFTSFAAAYLEGRGMKALDVLNDVAREHQRILFDAGATDTPPSTR